MRHSPPLVLALGATLLSAHTAHAQAYSLTTLATFNSANGATPFGGLTLGGGILYGATNQGGANNLGTVFALTPSAAPEPSQVAALSLGVLSLGGLSFKARRRKAVAKF